MSIRLLLALVLGMTALAACGAAALPGMNLDGRTFASTSVEGGALEPGTTITLTFRDGNLGINAGCNSMSGGYTIEGGRIRLRELATTEMACEPRLMEQDAWVAELFGQGPAVTLTGDALSVEGEGVRIVLVDRRVAEPARPLEGTRWVLDTIVQGEAASSVPSGVVAAFEIADGRASVDAGCNQGGADVEIAGDSVTFGPLALTKMACEPVAIEVEQTMASVLSGAVPYAIEGDRLTLTATTGSLVFRAEPAR